MCPSAPPRLITMTALAPHNILSQTKGVHLASPLCKAPCDQTWHWSNPTWPPYKGNRQRGRRGMMVVGAFLWCHYKRWCSWEMSRIHTCVWVQMTIHTSHFRSESGLSDSDWTKAAFASICQVISVLRSTEVEVGWTRSGELLKHGVICLVALNWAYPVIIVSLWAGSQEAQHVNRLCYIKQLLFISLWLFCVFQSYRCSLISHTGAPTADRKMKQREVLAQGSMVFPFFHPCKTTKI